MENAVIITASGEVYHCTGDLNSVDTITQLGDKLIGASVTHNHPAGSDNEYSFSDRDIRLFINYKLNILRGVDERFVYELNRNANDIDKNDFSLEYIISNVEENLSRHIKVVDIAKELKIGYRRWRRE